MELNINVIIYVCRDVKLNCSRRKPIDAYL